MIAEGLRARRVWVCVTVLLIAALAFFPVVATPFYVRVGQVVLLSAALALSWTLLGGFAGYWSFGNTAFIGLGAFSAGLVETELLGRAFMHAAPWSGFSIGLAVGAGASALIAGTVAWPILRLRGIYFAVAMLGVAQVLSELNNNVDIFKGSLGLVLPPINVRGMRPEVVFYDLLLAAFAIVLTIGFLIKISRVGHGLLALREDEDTARMLGVPTERYKTAMFVASAALTGALGVIYAHSLGYITTESVYRTDFSLNMIVYPLLGGIGTLAGPVVGALVMVVVTQVVLGRFLSVHMFLTGAILVALVLVAPKGIIGTLAAWRRRAGGA
jgi:branched-chain amino acid transport system permease protein